MAEDFKKVLTDSLKDVERKILAAHQKQVPVELGPGALRTPPRALPVPDPGILPRAEESGRSEDALQGVEDEVTPHSPRHFQLWSTYAKSQSFAMCLKEEDGEDDDLLSSEGGSDDFAKELEQERKLIAQTRSSRWVLSPNSPKRIGWDLAGVAILLYDLIMIPMYTAFPLAPNLFLDMMTGITLGFWTLDILACFCVGYYARDGTLVVSLRKIAKQYILSWFPLDVVIVSIDWVIVLALISEEEGKSAGLMRAGKMLRALRVLRTLRLLRLAKLRQLLNKLQDQVDSEHISVLLDIVKLLILIIFINHFIACAWYLVGCNPPDRSTSWLQVEFDTVNCEDATDQLLLYKYTTSMHWSLTQFTPASMEVTPKNEIERLFNVVVIMSAMVIFSTFISAITNAMNQLRNLNSERNEQASLLRRYMQQNNVSAPLKARVLQSIKALSQNRSRVHESDVVALRLLPLSLRHDLSQEVYAPHVGVHPFFYVCNACFSMQSRKIFSTCLAEKSLSTSQELITSGENATHMYFVIGGTLDYLADDRGENEPAIALDTGAWLCEAALWVRWQHNGTANTTAQGCELISVDAGGLQNILKDEKPVRQYANMFWKHFSDNPEDLSDVWCEEEVLFDWATRAMGQAETYYGDVIPAEPATTSNSKFSQFLQSQRRASSGFVGRRFSDDSLGGLMPSEFPAILVGAAAPGPEAGRLASQQEESDSSSSSGLSDSDE